ncbi:uracil phosphoribosyltransferase [Spiroplasma endosymbiont of Agriotes lineatus]|uniref:uracil phosphoribosyltransferase n=1 Tax=Spiroplasma endosymbiont of Agriotes lineatus TaxID=3077930 RepID=UPI0030D3D19C
MALFIIKHPLIDDKLTRLRKKDINSKIFKENVNEITRLMAYEVFRDLKLQEISIETPIVAATGKKIAQDIIFVPVLRAGLGMVDGMLGLVPNAKIGHIGIYRDEKSLQPKKYLEKKPNNVKNSYTLILDPMLATGGTAIAAIDIVKQWKVSYNIKFICLLAAPEGIEKLEKAHPDINIYTAAVDEKLNENGYIVPGLGDAGDRYFDTQ